MSADLLREAAAKMRERAQAATPGPWKYPHRNYPGIVMSQFGCLWYPGPRGHEGRINNEPDAEHIASWHPAVALAVADWLECQADTTCDCGVDESALTVARAYLGRS